MTHVRLVPFVLTVVLAVPAVLARPAAASQDDAPEVVSHPPAPARVAWFARYQDARGGPESSETVTRTFKVGQTGSLDIFNLAGPIIVSGAAGDEIIVTAVKRVRGQSGDAKAQLDAIVIDASETGGRVEVRTITRRTKNLSTWVDYSVSVPYGTAVSARSLAGDVKVSKVKGEVQIESASGTVEAMWTPRLLRVKTLSGDINIVEAASGGDALAASTVSGKLVAKGLKARSVELNTISGDLVLVNTACDRAQVRTVSGTLEFLGPLAKGGRYEFTSHAGDVRLKLAGSPGFELTAKTFSGDVHSDLPLVLGTGEQGPAYGPEKRAVRGTFGDGSALVIVKTFSGSVIVGKAEAPIKPKDKK
jgi:DUF4097 and DUF4098 domain-containing protein YvlB